MRSPSVLCVLQQQRGCVGPAAETAGVVRRAARYAGATRRGAATSATQFVDERRTVCSRRVSPFLSLRRFSLRSIKLIVRVDTNCACRPTRCSAKARTPGRQANPIARLFRASPLPDVFSFFFSSDGQIKFYLDSDSSVRESLASFFCPAVDNRPACRGNR